MGSFDHSTELTTLNRRQRAFSIPLCCTDHRPTELGWLGLSSPVSDDRCGAGCYTPGIG
jgi:hypothetical protein